MNIEKNGNVIYYDSNTDVIVPAEYRLEEYHFLA